MSADDYGHYKSGHYEEEGKTMLGSEVIKKDYDKVKASLTSAAPFLSSLLRKARIILTKSVETAGVTPKGVMALNPEFYTKLDYVDKAWLLGHERDIARNPVDEHPLGLYLHEVLHIAFRDPQRRGKRDPNLWNVAIDRGMITAGGYAINNHLLKSLLKSTKLEGFGVTLDKLYPLLKRLNVSMEDLEKATKEELYKLLEKVVPWRPRGEPPEGEPLRCPRCGSERIRCRKLTINGTHFRARMKCDDCGHEWIIDGILGTGGGEEPPRPPKRKPIPIDEVEIEHLPPIKRDVKDQEEEGEVLQEGDQDIYGTEDEGELDKKWKDEIFRAYTAQKTAGVIPAALKRLVDELFKPKVDWRTLLAQAFREGYNRVVVSTWMRPSRKHEEFPGIRRLTLPEIWALVDCSGSISEEELSQFLSEVYALAKEAPTHVIAWDSMAYDEIIAKTQQDVIHRVAKMMRGGGGTCVESALRKTLDRMKRMDAVVVLTDGEIFDWDRVQPLLADVSSKSSVAVFATTHRVPEKIPPEWWVIKVEVNKHS